MHLRTVLLAVTALFATAISALGAQGCGDGSKTGFGDDDGAGDAGAEAQGDDDGGCLGGCDGALPDAAGCVGLECQVNKNCAGGAKTTLVGRVFDPAGLRPLYNVTVFVPTDPGGALQPIDPGVHGCNTCDATIGSIVTATLTNENGEFRLEDVPTGTNIPLVVQVGKWRREIFVPEIADCVETAIADGEARLPRNQSEGDMPQMAVVTGGCDSLACLLRRVGIDDSEFTAPNGSGRLHVYKGVGGSDVTGGGAGDCTTSSCPLWASKEALEKYDIVLLTCECSEYNDTKLASQKEAMRDYLYEGGKFFGSHYHYTWFKNGPEELRSLANWTPGGGGQPYRIDTSFPKGIALRNWLENVNAIAPGSDTIPLTEVASDLGKVSENAQRWIYGGNLGTSNESVKYFSVNTPIGGIPAPDGGVSYCGKGVFSDIHVSGSSSSGAVPSTCGTGDLSPQEKALEFLFFDLSACVTDDRVEPPDPR